MRPAHSAASSCWPSMDKRHDLRHLRLRGVVGLADACERGCRRHRSSASAGFISPRVRCAMPSSQCGERNDFRCDRRATTGFVRLAGEAAQCGGRRDGPVRLAAPGRVARVLECPRERARSLRGQRRRRPLAEVGHASGEIGGRRTIDCRGHCRLALSPGDHPHRWAAGRFRRCPMRASSHTCRARCRRGGIRPTRRARRRAGRPRRPTGRQLHHARFVRPQDLARHRELSCGARDAQVDVAALRREQEMTHVGGRQRAHARRGIGAGAQLSKLKEAVEPVQGGLASAHELRGDAFPTEGYRRRAASRAARPAARRPAAPGRQIRLRSGCGWVSWRSARVRGCLTERVRRARYMLPLKFHSVQLTSSRSLARQRERVGRRCLPGMPSVARHFVVRDLVIVVSEQHAAAGRGSGRRACRGRCAAG